MTFDIYALTYELKKSSKSKYGAEFVATITDFGEVASQKSFLRVHLCFTAFVTLGPFVLELPVTAAKSRLRKSHKQPRPNVDITAFKALNNFTSPLFFLFTFY